MSRTKSSIKNFVFAMIGQALGLIISFIARIFFIQKLGTEYLGLNGLFTNLLSVLSLAELGVGNAITFSLYKPLAEQDIKKCKMLMTLYKKVYTVIGCIILIIGISIVPFLNFFISEIPVISHVKIIYILFVINTSISYFYSYKRNLIIADQNRYIATIYRYAFYFFYNLAQIIYLIFFNNYIVFLLIQILSTILENYFISKKADKMYPYLKDKDIIKLDKTSKDEIVKNTKAMMMHKIGGVVVSSTDNILLSKFVGLVAVGLYSNYYMIISALNTVFGQIFNSLTASIGNLCALDSTDKQYDVFRKINFITFWIYAFSSISLLCLFNQFIEIWVGKEYLFNINVVLILVVNFYITGVRKSVITFRDATGLFYADRWKSVIEAIINLVVSILLAYKFGTFGVFLGTFISSICTCVWIEPFVLYKYGFNKKLTTYFIDYFKKLFLTTMIAILTYMLCSVYNGNIYISFIINCLICCIVPNLILFIIYRKSDEFNYFYDKVFSKIVNKFFKKKVINE